MNCSQRVSMWQSQNTYNYNSIFLGGGEIMAKATKVKKIKKKKKKSTSD